MNPKRIVWDSGDNCYFSFHVASTSRRQVNHRVVAAMEKKMTNPHNWEDGGRLHSEVGGHLILALSEDDDKEFIKQCAALVRRLVEILSLHT